MRGFNRIIPLCYILLTLLTCVQFQEVRGTRVYAHYPGDILLAAFFPVHGRLDGPKRSISTKSTDTSICGEIQEEDGVQAMEALYYALDNINRHPRLLKGFSVGAVVLDSCDDDGHALEQAVDLIRVLMTRDDPNDLPYKCSDGKPPSLDSGAAEFYKCVGVVGGSSSGVSIQLGSLLKLFTLPQVSYLSTSPDLSQRDRYPYFKRTVPSDTNQAKAIVDILLKFGWTYVSVIYEDSNYGVKGYGELDKIANSNGICFALARRIDFDEPTWDSSDYEGIIKAMSSKTRVTVLWADYPRARRLFEAADRLNRTDVIWVGTDAWSGRMSAVEGLGHVVKNAITVQPLATKLEGFDEYFTSLDPNTNSRNPWFKEFWAEHFDCEWRNNTPTPPPVTLKPVVTDKRPAGLSSRDNMSQIQLFETVSMPEPPQNQFAPSKRFCTGNEPLGKSSGYKQQLNIHFISDAAQSFAQALSDIHNVSCSSGSSCEPLRPGNVSGPQLLDHLSKVKFQSASGKIFEFQGDYKIDGPPRYTIMSYRAVDDGHLDKGYTWVEVGLQSAVDGEEEIDIDRSFEGLVRSTYPEASCSIPCSAQQARIYTKGERCCWTCFNCSDWDVVVRVAEEVDEFCFTCLRGMQPNENHTTCKYITQTFMSHRSPWAIVSMLVASISILLAVFTMAIVVIFFNTPIIMASGRELSLVLLGVIILSYLSTFIMVAKPSMATCSLTRILMGICYTGVYSCILAKASRISRIFNDAAGSPAKRAKMTSPKSQMIIVGLLMLLEVLVLSVWFAASPPNTVHAYPSRDIRLLICKGSEDASYLIALVYPCILMLICIFYAFKTRKTPDGFNETKLITFTSYTTVVIWMAFVPLFFINSQNIDVRITTMCISLSVNATVALVCLFMPKVYICLFRPEKNTREAVMTRSQSVISSSNAPDMVNDGSRRNSRRDSYAVNPAWQTGVNNLASGANGATNGQRLSVTSFPTQQQHTPLRQRVNSATQTCSLLEQPWSSYYDPVYANRAETELPRRQRTFSDMMEKNLKPVTEHWQARSNEVDIEEVTVDIPRFENGRGRVSIPKADYRRISIARLKDLPGVDESVSTT